MKPETKAGIALACSVLALATASIDMVFILSCVLGIVGVLLARSALKAGVSPSGRGMAVAGTLGSAFAICVAFGAILGYALAFFLGI